MTSNRCTVLFVRSILLACTAAFLLSPPSFAAPITDGGPGGVGTTDGGADLAAWFRSDQGVFQDTGGTTAAENPGDPIGRWNDLSGHNRHATQGTAIRRPTLATGLANGNDAVTTTQNATGDADDQFLDTPNFGLSQAEHVFTTFRFNGGDGVNPSIFDGLGNNTMRMFITGGGNTANMFAGSSLGGNPPGSTGIFHNYGLLYNGGSSTLRADGNQLNSGNAGSGNPGGVRIGGTGFTDQDANSNIIEMAIFDRALNAAETALVENYQSSRTGVAMTAGDLYQGDTPGNGDFDFDVFGIAAFDPGGGLESHTSGGIGGLGIEATSALSDGESVLAGHNGINSGTTNAGLENMLNRRLLRAWYLDDRATTGLELVFDFSDAGLDPSLIDSFNELLFSSDGTMFERIDVMGTINGDRITFQLTADELQTGVFTLGTPPIPEPSSLALFAIAAAMRSVTRRRRRS